MMTATNHGDLYIQNTEVQNLGFRVKEPRAVEPGRIPELVARETRKS